MIKLAFTGDIMLSRGVEEALKRKSQDEDILSNEVKDKLQSFDFVIGNLECPVTSDALKINNNSFKAAPSNLNVVSDFDLLTLANNHIFDCGKLGATDTLKYLKDKGYKACGLKEIEHDNSFFVKNINDKKIGFIAAAVDDCIKNDSEYPPYIVRAEGKQFIEEVNELSSKVDYLFVLMHGGNEMISYPEPSFRKLCKKIIDVGASCVISHHPHVLGGYETHNNQPIVYSLGDFIFDGQSNKRRKGAILDVTIENNKIDFKIIPTQIDTSLQVQFADEFTAKRIIKRWNSVSKKILSINYDKKYKKLYIIEMLAFQLDRIHFLFKNEGLLATLKFMSKKVSLLWFYTSRIIKGKIK